MKQVLVLAVLTVLVCRGEAFADKVVTDRHDTSRNQCSSARTFDDALARAGACLSAGDTDQAVSLLREALGLAGADAPRLRKLLQICSRHEKAFQQLILDIHRHLGDLEPDRPSNLISLARACARFGHTRAALETAREIVRKWPNDPSALFSAGEVFEQLERPKEAVATYRNFVEMSPECPPDTVFAIARKCEAAGVTDTALALFRHVISRTEEVSLNLESFRGIVRAYAITAQYEEMAQTLIEGELIILDVSMASQIVHSAIIPQLQKRSLADALARALCTSAGLPVTRLLLAHLYLDLGQPDEARLFIANARNQAMGDGDTLRLIARACQRHKSLHQLGIDICRALVAREPDSFSNALCLADLYRHAGREFFAIREARRIVRKWRDDGLAMARAAYIFKRFGYWDDAIDAWQKAILDRSRSTDAWKLELVETCISAGRGNEARAMCEDLLSNTKNDVIRSLCRKKLAEISVNGSLAEGDFDKLAATLIEAEKNGDSEVVRNVLCRLLQGELSAASPPDLSKALAATVEGNPELVDCRLLLAGLYADLGEAAKANAIVTGVLQETTATSPLMHVADICAKRNDWPLAIQIQKRLIELEPDNYSLRSGLAAAYFASGDQSAGLAEVRNAIDLCADDAWGLFYIGTELRRAAEYDRAIDVYTRALQVYDDLDPPKPAHLDNLEWSCLRGLMVIYQQRGDLQKQIECAQEIAIRVPDVWAQRYARERIDAVTAQSGQLPRN